MRDATTKHSEWTIMDNDVDCTFGILVETGEVQSSEYHPFVHTS